MTGELLGVLPPYTPLFRGGLGGGGHINYNPIKSPQINGRLEFTFSAQILHYIKYLKYDALAAISNESELTP